MNFSENLYLVAPVLYLIVVEMYLFASSLCQPLALSLRELWHSENSVQEELLTEIFTQLSSDQVCFNFHSVPDGEHLQIIRFLRLVIV